MQIDLNVASFMGLVYFYFVGENAHKQNLETIDDRIAGGKNGLLGFFISRLHF